MDKSIAPTVRSHSATVDARILSGFNAPLAILEMPGQRINVVAREGGEGGEGKIRPSQPSRPSRGIWNWPGPTGRGFMQPGLTLL